MAARRTIHDFAGDYQMINLRNLNRVAYQMNRELQKIRTRTYAALEQAAEYLHRDILVTSPTVPKDKGPLRSSWFIHRIGTQRAPVILAGFNANYAAFVHEMVDGYWEHPTNWTEPGSGAKYLELGLQRNKDEIINIVRLNLMP